MNKPKPMNSPSLLRRFLNANVKACLWIEARLPARLSIDGNKTFLSEVVPNAVTDGDVVYDLGGGSQPFLSPELKAQLNAKQVGLDIDASELEAAPEGAYDKMIVHDLCTFEGTGEADVVVCQSTLEHVPDNAGAMRAIATSLKSGGKAYIFAPSRNAVFARLNLILPEALKKRLLFSLFPKKAEGHDGFKAYYDQCTPKKIAALASANGLEVEHRQLFWVSSYFRVFVPTYLLWRLIQGVLYIFLRDEAAETFIYVLRKS